MPKASTPNEVKDLVEALTGRPELSGSRDGAFTGVLVNQLAGAIFAGVKPDPEMVAVMQKASQVALQGIAPTDPLEGMFAAQMVATHFAAMECYRRAAIPEQSFEGRRMSMELGNKLVRSYAMLADALNKHRGKGQQIVRVEHVTVNAGGQAIVGHVDNLGGDEDKTEDRPHAKPRLRHASEPPMWGTDARGTPVSVTCSKESQALSDARRGQR